MNGNFVSPRQQRGVVKKRVLDGTKSGILISTIGDIDIALPKNSD